MSRDSALNGSRINELLARMREQDMDYRYMALNDLMIELQQSDNLIEETVCVKIIDAVLKSLTDTNGEVQNMAIKCLAPLVRRSRDPQIQVVLDRLVKSSAQADLQDLGSTALRTVILEVPPNSTSASSITKKLLPKLIDQLQNRELPSDLVLDTIDTLTELLSRFGDKIQNLPEIEQTTVIKVCLGFLGHARPAVRKRTIVALGYFSTKLNATLFSNLVSNVLQMFTSTREDLLLATLVDLCGQISRAEMECPDRNMFSPFLQSLLAPIMDALRHDTDELKESVFNALEAFVLQAGTSLNKFEYEVFDVASKYISYDPNYHVEVEDDEDMKEDDGDSDLASDFDDDDDYEV